MIKLRSLAMRILPAALALSAVGLCGAAEPSPITIAVSPPRIEIEIGDAPVTEAVRVFNLGTSAVRITTSVHAWHLDQSNRVTLEAPTEQSLDQWMIVSPLNFSIKPGESQTVRFSVRPKVRPQPGEHRAILYFEQAPEGDGPVQIVGRMGVAVYGYVGQVRRKGLLHEVQVDTSRPGALAHFDITSSGTAHVRLAGRYTIWRADEYPGSAATAGLGDSELEPTPLPAGAVESGALPGLPVLPDSRRRLTLSLPASLPPGQYVLDINGDLGERRIDLGVPFSLGPQHGPLAAVE